MYLLLLEGTYSKFQLSKKSQRDLAHWMEEIGMVDPVPPNELHVTLLSSRSKDADPRYYQWVKDRPKKPNPIILTPPFKLNMRDFGGAVVLEVDSPVLDQYYKDTFKFNIKYDFPSFEPHITLSYDATANKHLRRQMGTGKIEVHGKNIIGHGTKFLTELKAGGAININSEAHNGWTFTVLEVRSDTRAKTSNKSELEVVPPQPFIVSKKISPPKFPIELVNDELVEPWNPDEPTITEEGETSPANVTSNIDSPSFPISKKLKLFTRWRNPKTQKRGQ